jgi:hypothetical protein
MQLLFKHIQTIHEQKWAGVNWLITDKIMLAFNTTIIDLSSSIDFKANHSSPFWVDRVANGEGFLVNSFSYFTTVIIFTALVYLIARAAFFLLYRHRCSLYVRSFAFWPYLALMLMEGNLLQLIFFACGELQLPFSLKFSNRILNALGWLWFFILLMCATAFFPMLYSAYRNKIKYFSDNLQTPLKIQAVIYLTI